MREPHSAHRNMAIGVRATVASVGYREHPVPPRWRGLAECVWTSTAPSAPEVIDVLPDGCMDLVWSGAELFVAGPGHRAAPVRAEGRASRRADCGSFPGCCPRCSTCRPHALRDARVPLDALHPALARRARRGTGRAAHLPRRSSPRSRPGSPVPRPNPGCARPRPGWRGAARPPTTADDARLDHPHPAPPLPRRVRLRAVGAAPGTAVPPGGRPAAGRRRAGRGRRPGRRTPTSRTCPGRSARSRASPPLGWRCHTPSSECRRTPSRSVALAGRGATTGVGVRRRDGGCGRDSS